MNWVTIYDIRNAWGAWIAAFIFLFLIAFESIVLVGFLRLFRIASDATRKRKLILSCVVNAVVNLSLAAFCLWLSVHGFIVRSDLNAGRILETEGIIEKSQIEPGSKSNTMYFKVGDEWFQLPFQFSRICFPHNGEIIKLTYEPVADVKNRGPDAHEVLKMQLSHGCDGPIWG